MISRKIRSDLRFERDIAANFKEAKELIQANRTEYFVAVVDLHLPDAPKGEIVDYALHNKIPVIVFTSHFNDEIRETMFSKNVVDYIVKEGGPEVIDYLVSSIERFHKNQFAKILIVDDSKTSRHAMKILLENQKFEVLEAENGVEALSIMDEIQDIKMVITDYNMPHMDGFQLVTRIREKYPKNKLAIIGISAYGTSLMSARFLKTGASDFLTKPYLEEELYCRINQNLEMLEYIETINNLSNIDQLTGIFNRSYLFRFGQKLLENAKRGNLHLTVGIIDVDGLEAINDRYGYEAGDILIKEISHILTRNFRAADVVVRFGGGEFAVVAANMDKNYTVAVFDRVRNYIENKQIKFENHTFSVTVTIGVTTHLLDSLEQMIKKAHSLHVQAKKKGKNQVIVE